MRRRGSGGGGGDGEAHVTINVQEETVRSRGMGSRATTAAAAAAAAASGGPGGTPLDALLKEPGAGKHAEVLRYLKKTLDEERREFSRLQQDVFDSLTEHEVMEASFDRQFDHHQTFGGQAADYVAAVGGSWRFLFGFAVFIAAWAVANASVFGIAWDPYPYILLNLFLSCMAGFQAPVIMMSQNRQVERDRGLSDYTARVNLRAELVTRHINAKLDAFISTAWRRLYESQAIQTSTIQSLLELERQQVKLVRAMVRAQAQSRGRAGSTGEDIGESGGGANPPGEFGAAFTNNLSAESLLSYRKFGRRPSEEVLESPAPKGLVPGTVLQVYDDDADAEEIKPLAAGQEDGGGDSTNGHGDASSSSPQFISEKGEPPPSSSLVVQVSSLSVALAPAPALGIYATPLAALCVAPPAARSLRALNLPWLLETEEDPHTIFLMRTMLRAVEAKSRGSESGSGGVGMGNLKGLPLEETGSGLWEDAERMIFEHRSSSQDNFFGKVSRVHIQSRDPSLATKGVVCTVPEATADGGARRVAPAFVSRVVETASLVDTGGGAEPWFPFDVAYDMSFQGEGAALDSLLAGEAILTLRNALDLPFQTSMGEIRQMTLHLRGNDGGAEDGCGGSSHHSAATPISGASISMSGTSLSLATAMCAGRAIHVRQGEIPPRFKPSLSQDRDDRISDFWKMPLSRVQISYSPAPIFACVTLRPGQSVVPLSVQFLSHLLGPQSHPPSQPPSGGEFVAPPMSRQGSGSGMGILLGLTRQSSFKIHHPQEPQPQGGPGKGNKQTAASTGELVEPAPQHASSANAASSGPPLTHSHSLKRVIELWHGRHADKPATPDAGHAASTNHGSEEPSEPQTRGERGSEEKGKAEAAAAEEEGREGHRLLAIVNPSAQALCEALARGAEWTGKRGSQRWRKGGRGKEGDDGRKEGQDEEEAGPLHLDALSPEALDSLPHNRWLALPLHKAASSTTTNTGGGGNSGGNSGNGRPRTGTYEIDMPMISGPAVVFFYSPHGRMRLRGMLRDDGAEPILEMD